MFTKYKAKLKYGLEKSLRKLAKERPKQLEKEIFECQPNDSTSPNEQLAYPGLNKSSPQLQMKNKKKDIDELIDNASKETFPASDTPAWATGNEEVKGSTKESNNSETLMGKVKLRKKI